MKICYLVGAMGTKDGGFMPDLKAEDCLIAVDGGFAQIKEWDLKPNHIVGDFDSLGYEPKEENTQVLPVRKDETDMEYAMKLGISLGYKFFLIQGGLGGRLDHSYANLQLLLQLRKKECHGILLGDGQSITLISNEKISFPPNLTGVFSVFAVEGEAKGVTLSNLSYPVKEVSLYPSVPLGVSNEFLEGKEAKVQVEHGNLMLIWEGIQSQSEYVSMLNSLSE